MERGQGQPRQPARGVLRLIRDGLRHDGALRAAERVALAGREVALAQGGKMQA